MALRFHLYNDRLGALEASRPDPIGINDISQSVKRSEEHEGIVFEIVFNVQFLEEARDFIKACYENDGGIDAVIHASVYDMNPNSREWEHFGTGRAGLQVLEIGEEVIIITIDKVGVEHRVLNQMTLPVNMEGFKSENGSDLLPVVHYPVLYHSKVIFKELRLEAAENIIEDPERGVEYMQAGVNATFIPKKIFYSDHSEPIDKLSIGGLGLDVARVDELKNNYPQPHGYADLPTQFGHPSTVQGYSSILNLSNSITLRSPVYLATEVGLADVNVKLTYRHKVVADIEGGDLDIFGDNNLGVVEIWAWYEHRDAGLNLKALEKIGEFSGERIVGSIYDAPWKTISFNKKAVPVVIGDKFYVYETVRIWGTYNKPDKGTDTTLSHTIYIQPNPKESFISFASTTEFLRTRHNTVLIFEAVKRCLQYYTNIDDCFYSELLGRVDLGYEVDGEASLIGFTNGSKLRNLTKPIILVLKELLNFINARYCIGYGFKVIDDKLKFVVEKREQFYDKGLRILSLGPVVPRRKVNPKYFWHLIKYGYTGKLDIGQVNAIDEFNSERVSGMPVINSINELILTTGYRASGNQVEYQRRLQGATVDSNLDDDIFVLSLIRDGLGYKTKSTEGYDLTKFDNIRGFESQYNYDLTPKRFLEAWKNVLASNCIRSKSNLVRFGSGTVNYELVSKRLDEAAHVRENEDLELVGIEPLYDTEDYTFNFQLTRDEWKIIKANPYGYIEFYDHYGNIYEGFINNEGIEYDSVKKIGAFSLRRVNRIIIPAKEYDEAIKNKFFTEGVLNVDLSKYVKLKTDQPASDFLRSLIPFIQIR